MKYVIFGNPALCWLMSYYLKSISPNILIFVTYDDKDEKCVEVNKSLIDKLKFFGFNQKDFFLGCLYSEDKYTEPTNVITMDDLLEISDVSYTLDVEKTTSYFQSKCEEVYRRWNENDDPSSMVDRVHVTQTILEGVVYDGSKVSHLELSEHAMIIADVFIDMRTDKNK